jgi:tetratricopeptide (TPR) repeat protein
MSGRCCDDATLLALSAGDLSAAQATSARDHVGSCAACAASLEALDAARVAFAPEEPSPFASARMQRELSRALDGEIRAQRHAWRGQRVVVAVAVAAMSGAAIAMTAAGTFRSEPPPAPAPAPAPGPQAQAPLLAEVPRPPVVEAAPVTDAVEEQVEIVPEVVEPPARRRVAAAALPQSTPLQRAETALAAAEESSALLEAGDLFEEADAPERAVEAWVPALATDTGDAARLRLSRLVRRGVVDPDEVLARVAEDESALRSAEGMRMACEWGLKYRQDRRAVADCQAFGRAFPAHPATRALALAAGSAAETRLGDLELAVAEYSRALLVSEYAGVPGTDALVARARARAKMGERDEAQADLRLYLHVVPHGWNRAEIRDLALQLGLERAP